MKYDTNYYDDDGDDDRKKRSTPKKAAPGFFAGRFIVALVVAAVTLSCFCGGGIAVFVFNNKEKERDKVLEAAADPEPKDKLPELDRRLATAPRPSGDDRAYLLEHLNSPVRAVAVSADGKKVAAGCHDGRILLWDLANGKPGPAFRGHHDIVSGLAFTPDGQTLVSASYDKTLILWDTATGQIKKSFAGHNVAIWSLSLNSTGNVAASAGPFDERGQLVLGAVRIWDLQLGVEKELGDRKKTIGGITSLALNSDGNSVFLASTDSTVRRWDLVKGKLAATYHGHKTFVWALAVSPDGKRIAAGDDFGAIRIWDVASKKELHILPSNNQPPVHTMVFSPDGSVLVSLARNRTIRFWDTGSGALLTSLTEQDSYPSSLAITPDGKTLVCGRGQYDPAGQPLVGDVKVWDLDRILEGKFAANKLAGVKKGEAPRNPKDEGPKAHAKEIYRFVGHESPVVDVAFSPAGQTAVSGGADARVFLWNVETGEVMERFDDHTARVIGVAFTPDGQKIVSGAQDKTVRIWNIALGKEERRLDHPASLYYWLRVTPDGTRLLTSTEVVTTMHVWDLDKGKQLRSFGYRGDAKGNIWISDYSADGRRALSCGQDKNLRIWDIDAGSMVRILDKDSINGAFSPDGRFVLAWGIREKFPRLYEAESGNLIRRFAETPNGIHSASFSRDGRRALTADEPGGNGAILWDVQSGTQICRIAGNPKGISILRFAPDGKRALSAGRDGSVRLWQLPD